MWKPTVSNKKTCYANIQWRVVNAVITTSQMTLLMAKQQCLSTGHQWTKLNSKQIHSFKKFTEWPSIQKTPGLTHCVLIKQNWPAVQLPSQTVYWYHRDCRSIVRPRWTCGSLCRAPSDLEQWSDSLGRRPRTHVADELCLCHKTWN